MVQKYALLDKDGGWIVNIILWDGDTEKWQPPTNTIAVPVSEINFSTLPQPPEE